MGNTTTIGSSAPPSTTGWRQSLSAVARQALHHAETKEAAALVSDMATLLDLGGVEEARAILGFLRDEFSGDAATIGAAIEVLLERRRADLAIELGVPEDDPRLLSRPASPRDGVWINLTSRCNLRCIYCTKGKPGHVDEDISAESLAKVMAFVRMLRPPVHVGCYTETTSYKGWAMVVRELLEISPYVSIISNLARPLDAIEVDTFARCGKIQTSVDTVDRDKLRAVRRGADIRIIFQNVLRIRGRAYELGRRPPLVEWICVPTGDNMAGLMELVGCAIASGVGAISINSPMLQFDESKQKFPDLLDLPDEELRDAFNRFEKAAELARSHGVSFILPNRELIVDRLNGGAQARHDAVRVNITAALGKVSLYSRPLSPGRTRLCLQPWNMVVLSEKGELYPCTICGIPLAKLDDFERLDDALWASPLRQWRRDLLTGNPPQACMNCPRPPEGGTDELTEMVRGLQNG